MADRIHVTVHAYHRWRSRSDQPEQSPDDAWFVADPVEGTTFDADEVRYHDDSGTLLLRKDRSLVTVIDIDAATAQTRNAVAAVIGGLPA